MGKYVKKGDPRKEISLRVVELDGVAKTVAEWSSDLGIPRRTIIRRLRLGMSPDKILAAGRLRPTRGRTMVTIDGETKSLLAWCEDLGVGYGMVRSRVVRGMDPVEALKSPYKSHKERQASRRSPLRAICEDAGKPFHLVNHRILSYGWDLQRALTTPVLSRGDYRRKGKYVVVNGERMTYAEASRTLGGSLSAFKNRIKAGWSPDEAGDFPIAGVLGNKHHRSEMIKRRREIASLGIVI